MWVFAVIAFIAGFILINIECIKNTNCANYTTGNNDDDEDDRVFNPINSYDAANMWNGIDDD